METIRVRKLNHANLHISCESGTAAELREFFSFYVPGYKFMPAYKNRMWDGKIRLFDANSGELPAGLFFHLKEFARNRAYMMETIETDYGLPDELNEIDPNLLLTKSYKDKKFRGITAGEVKNLIDKFSRFEKLKLSFRLKKIDKDLYFIENKKN